MCAAGGGYYSVFFYVGAPGAPGVVEQLEAPVAPTEEEEAEIEIGCEKEEEIEEELKEVEERLG